MQDEKLCFFLQAFVRKDISVEKPKNFLFWCRGKRVFFLHKEHFFGLPERTNSGRKNTNTYSVPKILMNKVKKGFFFAKATFFFLLKQLS